MTELKDIELSKFLSLILRHSPEKIDIELDKFGYVEMDILIIKANKRGYLIKKEQLLKVVETNTKKRFKIDSAGEKIKANQGHSFPVDLDLEPVLPPKYLFHGTREGYESKIEKEGLKKMKRTHVHMNSDYFKSYITGGRSSKKSIVFQIDSEKMQNDGFEFLHTENDVWLAEYIPPEYLKSLPIETYIENPINIQIEKKLTYTKLTNSDYEILSRSSFGMSLSKVYCYICERKNANYKFEHKKIICSEMSYDRNTLQHTLNCTSYQVKISQDEKFIEVNQSSTITIPSKELNQFQQQIDNRKIEANLDFEGIGLWFNCPLCNHENRVFNIVRIGEEIECSNCNKLILKTENKVKIEINIANNV